MNTNTARWILTALMVAGFYILVQYITRTEEAFETGVSPTLVMLGDSILNNTAYVAHDESVEYLLRQKNSNSIVFLAQDNACIGDVLQTQIPKIPTTTTTETHIFLSAGGNDILNAITGLTISTEGIQRLFETYKQLILAIQTNCPTSRLHLFNLYYPTSALLKPYYKYIDAWNHLLRNFVSQSNNALQEFPMAKLCFVDIDFVHVIEPSAICSKKIVQSILSSVTTYPSVTTSPSP